MNKVIGLISTVGFAGLVGLMACSSTTTTSGTTPEAGTSSSSGGDGSVKPKPEAGPETCPVDVTGAKAEIAKAITDQLGGFKVSAPAAGQCSNAALTKLEADVTAQTIKTWDDVATSLGGACGACAVTDKAAATWGAIIKVTADGAIVNGSGSLSAQGMSKACAETLFAFDYCADIACQDCADDATQQCKQDVQSKGGGCANEYAADITANCPKADGDIETATFNAAKAAGLKLIITYAIYNACGAKVSVATDGGTGG